MDEPTRKIAESAVEDLLIALGEDIDRPGLKGTPARVVRAWEEMVSGMDLTPETVLQTSTGDRGFRDGPGGFDQMVVMAGIRFTSVCEHHLLPFIGTASVGYIPGEDGIVVGASKLARLVDLFARRLQLQERLTQQVAEALVEFLKPAGVGVLVQAEHQCMACRGVRKVGASMRTQVLLGSFRDHEVRAEFWELTRKEG